MYGSSDRRDGCGDGRDIEFLDTVIGEAGAIDTALLDPPYNVKINGFANARGRHAEFAMASGEMSPEGFQSFLVEALDACATVLRDGAVYFVCMDWRHLDDASAAAKSVYGSWLNLCVWNKSNAGMGSLYRSKHELVLVYKVGMAPHLNAVELAGTAATAPTCWIIRRSTP